MPLVCACRVESAWTEMLKLLGVGMFVGLLPGVYRRDARLSKHETPEKKRIATKLSRSRHTRSRHVRVRLGPGPPQTIRTVRIRKKMNLDRRSSSR